MNDIERGWGQEKVSDDEGGDGDGWGITGVHEGGECAAKLMIVSQFAFEIFGVVVCVSEQLTWGTVWTLGACGTTSVRVSCVKGTSVMGTGMVAWDVGEGLGERGGVSCELVVSEKDAGERMLGTLCDWFVGSDSGRRGKSARNMIVDESIHNKLNQFRSLKECECDIGPCLSVQC